MLYYRADPIFHGVSKVYWLSLEENVQDMKQDMQDPFSSFRNKI